MEWGSDRGDHNPCHHVCGMAEGVGRVPPRKGSVEGRLNRQQIARLLK